VQGHIKLVPGTDRLAVHRHLVVDRINLGSKLADNMAVDGDAAVQNELFRRAPRSHASLGQEFLQANAHDSLNRINDLTIQRFSELHFRLGLAEAGNSVAGLPLAALFEEIRALETLENIALAAKLGRRAQTGML
jgi:hypothetical protein